MNLLTRTRVMVLGLSIIGGVNAIALGGVAWNRSGTPDATLHLSERELQPAYDNDGGAEDDGLALSLRWRVPVRTGSTVTDPQSEYLAMLSGPPIWLDVAKLRQLGFDTSRLSTRAHGEGSDSILPRRDVLLVLELDGPAAQLAIEAARRADAERAAQQHGAVSESDSLLDQEQHHASRLFVVDAGLDQQTLRQRYPDRSHYAIVHGVVRAEWVQQEAQPILEGFVTQVSGDTVQVDKSLRPVFDGLTGRRPLPSELFSADVAFGQRLEPWMTAARKD